MKRLHALLFLVSVVLLPFLPLLLALPILGALNPLVTAFLVDISVTNRTGETIRVTPIGASGAEAERCPLPIYSHRGPPSRMSSQLGGFIVQPGQTRVILYDYDDANLAEIVVEREEGDLLQLVVNPSPELNRYSPPALNAFVIEDFTALAPIGGEVRVAFDDAQEEYHFLSSYLRITWPLLSASLLPWVVFLYLLKRRRLWQGRPYQAESSAQARIAPRSEALLGE
ncbi:MAG: hypothetical protein ACF8NJ_04840 [Phycisphaerales bacterium JB038]